MRNIRVATFKLFPRYGNSKDWYYKVYIFGSKKTMYEFRKKIQRTEKMTQIRKFNFEAIVSSYESKENKKQFGIILFYKGSAKRSGVVAHELTHAAVYWWKSAIKTKWSKIQTDARADEEFAYLVSGLVKQYWVNWWDLHDKKKT